MKTPLSESQLQRLTEALHLGARTSSDSMAMWLSVPSLIEIDEVDQLPIREAVDVLGDSDQILCFCFMEMTGSLTGGLILAFDDQSGLSLADLVLNQPVGSATEWGEVEQSAALETANIIGSAYLNSLSLHLNATNTNSLRLLPSPPTFRREFVESLLQTAFLAQAIASDYIFVASTKFQIRGELLNWTMLFIPDADSIGLLKEWIGQPR